jgi:putative membrane protein
MADETTHAVPHANHATELLANERTFLAWVRTSIAVISLGFAVTKFDVWLRQMAQATGAGAKTHGIGWSLPMGLTMIVLGALLSVFAGWRYHAVNLQIECGEVRADRDLVVMVVALVVLLAIVFVLYFLKSGG